MGSGCMHTRAPKPAGPVEPSLMPPTAEEMARTPKSDNVLWFERFQQAESNLKTGAKSQACVLYGELAADPRFPLNEYAMLKSYQACPLRSRPALEWKSRLENSYVYLDDLIKALEAQWGSLEDEEKILVLWQRSSLEKDERKKEGFLKQAVEIAQTTESDKWKLETQQNLFENSPRLMPQPKPEDLAAVAADWRKWRDFKKSVEVDRQRLQARGLSDEEHYQILKTIRQTWKAGQQKNEMLIATTDLLNYARNSFRLNKADPQAPKRLLEARVLFARTVWTEQRKDLAVKSLNDARRELTGRVSLEEVYFILGRIEDENGDLKSAEGFFNLALKEKPSQPGIRDKVRWNRAWILHKQGKKPAAVKAFLEIAEESKDIGEKSRARYWAARDSGKTPKRTELYRLIQKEDPLGYYSVLATRELKEAFAPINPVRNKAYLPLTGVEALPQEAALQAEWLIALDLNEIAQRQLDRLQVALKKSSANDMKSWLTLGSAYARAGKYLTLFSMLTSLNSETRDALLKNQPDVLFPMAWQKEVEGASREANIPPALLFSIIRQESGFDPHARSPSEAYGLTQVIPSVASTIASRHKIPYRTAEDMFTPAISIRLGAWELRGLMNRWGGQWIPTVASYNANPEAVKGWLKMRHRKDPVEFIEELPYEETRSYVKLILRNHVFYQRMLSKAPTPFPEKCLSFKQL